MCNRFFSKCWVGLFLLCSVVCSGSLQAGEEDLYVDYHVESIDDLANFYCVQQESYLLGAPPSFDPWMQRVGMALSFDVKSFRKRFLKQAFVKYVQGVPVYELAIIEDPSTGDLLFYNNQDQLLHSIFANNDYDPNWFVFERYPGLLNGEYTEEEAARLMAWYAPSRVQLSLTLVPSASYLQYQQASIASAPVGGMAMAMMAMGGGGSTEWMITNYVTAGTNMMVAFESESGSYYKLEEATSLTNASWQVVKQVPGTNGSLVVTNEMVTPPDVQYYRVIKQVINGAGDVDSDGDGWSDGEELVQGTDPDDRLDAPFLGRGVVINEVLYNEVGSDTGKEWIELFSTNRYAIDLEGFRIQQAGTSFSTVYTFPAGSILEPGDFMLIGGNLVSNVDVVVNFTMPNRFSAGPTGGVRISVPTAATTTQNVVDACLYAQPNNNGLPTEGFGTDGFASWAAAGYSVVRKQIGRDTDSYTDWKFSTNATPTASGQLTDLDNDGLTNFEELTGFLNPYGGEGTHYLEPDTDGDGLNDSAEVITYGTDPNDIDTDGDMYPFEANGTNWYYGTDWYEVMVSSTDPLNGDEDLDGLPDGWEFVLGLTVGDDDSDDDGDLDGEEDFDNDGVSNGSEANQNSDPTDAMDIHASPYNFVLSKKPYGSWSSGADMHLNTTIRYGFENILWQGCICALVTEGGNTNESFSVSWEGVESSEQEGDRTVLTCASVAGDGGSAMLIVEDGGTTWPFQNSSEEGADIEVEEVSADFIKSSGTKYGYDDTRSRLSVDAVSVELSASTEIEFEYGPSSMGSNFEFQVSSSLGGEITVSPTAPAGSPQVLTISGVSEGEAPLTANLTPLDKNADRALVGVYPKLNKGVKFYYVNDANTNCSDVGCANSNPLSAITSRWIQAVVGAAQVDSATYTIDYDLDDNCALNLSGIEMDVIALELENLTGVDPRTDDDIWIVFVNDFEDRDKVGAWNPNLRVGFVRCEHTGDDHDDAITIAHEFGHAIGCEHVGMDCVMHEPGFGQSDFIPYNNWIQVDRD